MNRRFVAWILAAACVGSVTAAAALQDADSRVRPQDVLNVAVTDQLALTNKFSVDPDGRVTLPLIGRIQAAGLTADQLAAEMRRRLADGFVTNPQVRVVIERVLRVFVFGGVTNPGMYQLTPAMTLVELLARAGYQGASEAIIVRGKDPRGPAMPDEKDAKVMSVNLREFEKEIQSGQLSRNILLNDGDTIYVPRYDPNRVYVSGQVRNAGAYSIPDKTTVLQVIALAGGPTERASLGRVRIIRLAAGKQQTIKAKLEDIVHPGDTIIVPERFF